MKEAKCVVAFPKCFVSGPLHGVVFQETEVFLSWDDALAWAKDCNKSHGCDFEVPFILNVETGQKKRTKSWFGF